MHCILGQRKLVKPKRYSLRGTELLLILLFCEPAVLLLTSRLVADNWGTDYLMHLVFLGLIRMAMHAWQHFTGMRRADVIIAIISYELFSVFSVIFAYSHYLSYGSPLGPYGDDSLYYSNAELFVQGDSTGITTLFDFICGLLMAAMNHCGLHCDPVSLLPLNCLLSGMSIGIVSRISNITTGVTPSLGIILILSTGNYLVADTFCHLYRDALCFLFLFNAILFAIQRRYFLCTCFAVLCLFVRGAHGLFAAYTCLSIYSIRRGFVTSHRLAMISSALLLVCWVSFSFLLPYFSSWGNNTQTAYDSTITQNILDQRNSGYSITHGELKGRAFKTTILRPVLLILSPIVISSPYTTETVTISGRQYINQPLLNFMIPLVWLTILSLPFIVPKLIEGLQRCYTLGSIPAAMAICFTFGWIAFTIFSAQPRHIVPFKLLCLPFIVTAMTTPKTNTSLARVVYSISQLGIIMIIVIVNALPFFN